MNFCEVFLGVSAGLIVGLIVHLIVNWIIYKIREKRLIAYFKYEIDINIKKINSFIKELAAYKGKVLADSINKYYGWFYLGEIILTTVNQFFVTGLIYKKFNYEEIEELQKFQKDFSWDTERYLNDQVKNNVQNFLQGVPNMKELALNQIEFWENKFNNHISKLEVIKNKLK